MRKEVADIWSKALRSGEFTQGKFALEESNKCCPLGVLTLLAMTVGVCDHEELSHFSFFNGVAHKLPDSVKNWAKMYGNSGEIKGEFVNLTWFNDIGGWTFSEIADIIDKNWENL